MTLLSSRPFPASAPSEDLSWDRALSEARRRALGRTVQALFRERLLDARQLIPEGSVAWLPLWGQQALLRFEGLQLGRSGACRLEGAIACYGGGRTPRPIGTPAALLAALAPSLGCAEEALTRLQAELDNSVDNDALCLHFRTQWGRELRAQWAGRQGLIDALQVAQEGNPTLLLEQWGCLGHPWHPNYKTKMGLGREEVTALSPEFRARLSVPLLALRAGQAHVESAGGVSDYRAWFAARFPAAWDDWQRALHGQGLAADDWLPLPAHPFQAARVLPQDFAAEIAAGVLRPLPGVSLPASPTMSFRTVVPDGDALTPHLKLPVSLRLTSVQRTVSPKSAVMGPRLTALLRALLAAEDHFGGTLDVLGEELGVHYLDPHGNDDRARHLAVLYRENPLSRRDGQLFPVPVGALFADSPFDGRALVTELVSRSETGPAAALRFYQRYLRVALRAVLAPYLLYGIAFEAHQQNSFMLIDGAGRPARLLLRDFGDLRLHRPTLLARGRDIAVHRAGHTAFDSEEPVRDKLLHAVFLCHFAELGLLLAREYHLDEDEVWALLRAETAAVFEELRERTDPARWQAERAALLEQDWPAKSFVRMRLSDSSDDLHGSMPNPLRPA